MRVVQVHEEHARRGPAARSRAVFGLVVSTSTWIAIGAGCGTERAGGDPPPASDPDAGAVVSPDARVIAQPADAGVIEVPPPPPAPRRLVRRALFGDGPPDNRVFNPVFDLNAEGWFAFSGSGEQMQYAFMTVRHHARTPGGQPVLVVPKGGYNGESVSVLGTVKGAGGPLELAVWIGRSAEAELEPRAQVSALGLGDSGREVAVDLAPGSTEGTTVLELDGIRWIRYAGMIQEPTAGWVHLFAVDDSRAHLLVTGALARPLAARRAGPPAPSSLSRELRAAERAALRSFAARQRDKLGEPRNRRQTP